MDSMLRYGTLKIHSATNEYEQGSHVYFGYQSTFSIYPNFKISTLAYFTTDLYHTELMKVFQLWMET